MASARNTTETMAFYEICHEQDLLPLPVLVEENLLHFIVTEGGPFAQGWLWHLVGQIRQDLDVEHHDECLVAFTLAEDCLLHAHITQGNNGWVILVEFAGQESLDWE